MAKKSREASKQFSVKFPTQLTEEIDTICTSHYISRAAWLIKAAKAQIEKERMINTEELLQKLEKKEEQ